MEFSSHGHYIGSDPERRGDTRGLVARCGGPGMCSKCKQEQDANIDSIRDHLGGTDKHDPVRARRVFTIALSTAPHDADLLDPDAIASFLQVRMAGTAIKLEGVAGATLPLEGE